VELSTGIQILRSWFMARLNLKTERGATAVEYGVMVALIAAVIIVAVVFLGNKTSSTFSCTASNMGAGTGATGC
jgi:pilus assembly protein Flp/PilA